jgi:hypothetical protein
VQKKYLSLLKRTFEFVGKLNLNCTVPVASLLISAKKKIKNTGYREFHADSDMEIIAVDSLAAEP